MTWKDIIKQEQEQGYYKNLKSFIDKRYEETVVFPPKNLIFNAFIKCPFDKLKLVILGQDPYHRKFQAQGMSFSTPKNIQNPPSMMNILKEIRNDLKRDSICLDGDLTPWARQGVLLLNTVLTVEEGKANSHKGLGWEDFTDNIIKIISAKKSNIVFLLWGNHAISKRFLIDENRHCIIQTTHPSPFSADRGFLGSSCFSKANEYLKNHNIDIINW